MTQHKNAPKGSGGVAILGKSNLFDVYNVQVIDNCYDGILCIKFENVEDKSSFIVCSCYLPPENSPYGRDAVSFYAHLLSLIYLYKSAVNGFYICGDLNSRIGNMSDIVGDIDCMTDRTNIDVVINQHGKCLVEFLQEALFCTVNGRITVNSDGYTSRGSSVVDYILVPHEQIDHCVSWKVLPCTKVIEENNLSHMLGNYCKLPDHSMLVLDVCMEQNHSRLQDNRRKEKTVIKKKYKLNQIPNNFMQSKIAQIVLQDVIHQIQINNEKQEEVDNIYRILCMTVINEMDRMIPCYDCNKTFLGQESRSVAG